jgi:hypothetical protein
MNFIYTDFFLKKISKYVLKVLKNFIITSTNMNKRIFKALYKLQFPHQQKGHWLYTKISKVTGYLLFNKACVSHTPGLAIYIKKYHLKGKQKNKNYENSNITLCKKIYNLQKNPLKKKPKSFKKILLLL